MDTGGTQRAHPGVELGSPPDPQLRSRDDKVVPARQSSRDGSYDVTAARAGRLGGRVVPAHECRGVTDDERDTRRERFVAGALHRVLSRGQGKCEVGTAQQRPVAVVVEVARERDVVRDARDIAARRSGQHELDVRQRLRRLENVAHGLVGIPAAGIDDTSRQPFAPAPVNVDLG